MAYCGAFSAALPSLPSLPLRPPGDECNNTNESMVNHCDSFNFVFNSSCPAKHPNETVIEVASGNRYSGSTGGVEAYGETSGGDMCKDVKECLQGCFCQDTHAAESHGGFFDIPEGHFFGLLICLV